jgi:hypothetical protein
MGYENRPEARAKLERGARQALKHPEAIEPMDALDRMHVTLRLWHYPAFFNHVAWSVFEPHSDEAGKRQMLVREVLWDRTHDLARFSDPLEGAGQGFNSPATIHVRDAAVPAREYRRLLREIAAHPVTLVQFQSIIGLDGERFGIASAAGFNAVCVEWWGDGPKQWRDFIAAVTRLREFLRSCY